MIIHSFSSIFTRDCHDFQREAEAAQAEVLRQRAYLAQAESLPPPPPEEAAPLPPGWIEGFDPNSGLNFYYNSATGTSVWERPVA